MRSLIVDDQPGVRSVIGSILSRTGAVCEMAATAEEALKRLTHERFDIALLDIGLPDMDGLTLARRIQRRDPDIALVMITGASDVGSVIAAMQAGAADYVVKPFEASALIHAFERAADRRRSRLEAGRTADLNTVIAERTLEIRVLLSQRAESAQGLANGYLAALRVRDAAAGSHAERVAALSRTLGVARGMNAAELDLVERAAILHDIGKFALPDTMLLRREPLTQAEIQVVRRHPEYGSEVLRNVPGLADCAEVVLAQLEHYDGSGTPMGLRGEQIPLAARIIAVANVYDVMTRPRRHARQLSSIDTLHDIEAYAGTRFEPTAVMDLFTCFGLKMRSLDQPSTDIGE